MASYTHEAYVARKRELRAELGSASGDKLLNIGTELETLERSFQQARRGAKTQLRELGGRYVPLFKRLFLECDKHADQLLIRANEEWAKHFASFGAKPSGTSPIAQAILTWKQQLVTKRQFLGAIEKGMSPPPPSMLLPYSAKR
ncbi:MAG: hypothetical protein WDM96_12300 [Lacunisphaera sp.]